MFGEGDLLYSFVRIVVVVGAERIAVAERIVAAERIVVAERIGCESQSSIIMTLSASTLHRCQVTITCTCIRPTRDKQNVSIVLRLG